MKAVSMNKNIVGLMTLLAALGCKKAEEAAPDEATAMPSAPAASEKATPVAAKADTPKEPLAPKPGTLRLVKDFEEEPLDSEQSKLEKFVTYLKEKEGPSVDAAPRSEEEASYLASYRKNANDSEALPELPYAWGGFETVVVLSVRAPVGEEGRRRSGRSKGRLLFHPPEKTPVYSVLYGDKWGTSFDGGELARWVLEDLAIRVEEKSQAAKEVE